MVTPWILGNCHFYKAATYVTYDMLHSKSVIKYAYSIPVVHISSTFSVHLYSTLTLLCPGLLDH